MDEHRHVDRKYAWCRAERRASGAVYLSGLLTSPITHSRESSLDRNSGRHKSLSGRGRAQRDPGDHSAANFAFLSVEAFFRKLQRPERKRLQTMDRGGPKRARKLVDEGSEVFRSKRGCGSVDKAA